ncbi:MAG: fructosamine kinase family protein [Propionibacteriaceae bacterium]|nr:fructosamine kinase family protein [Propionibacteriaceae bacterium]
MTVTDSVFGALGVADVADATTFVKRVPGAPEGFFAAEAAGLRWLAVDGGAKVAGVIDVDDDAITLERIERAEPTAQMAEEFGRALATTHDAGAAGFGAKPDGYDGPCYIGDTTLPMPDSGTRLRWGEFYAAYRVMPYADTALISGALSRRAYEDIVDLAQRLTDGDFDDGFEPSRIHGDLWAGNVLFSSEGAVLIDPAAHGGHRLTDLAMLALFGMPHLETIWSAYEEVCFDLPDHWRELIGLHQLHPLLVHTVLFGGTYGGQAHTVAKAYL